MRLLRRYFNYLHPFTFLLFALILHCPKDEEDALMLHFYHTLNDEIQQATMGTELSSAYLAALISLETYPAGNRSSHRFEPVVYRRLLDLKYQGRRFGYLKRSLIRNYSDNEIRELATSHGMTQIMGYHCLDLGCSVEDLRSDFHLQWAVGWMLRNYRSRARKKDWAACFRIHNTGRPDGRPARPDYVKRGLIRMKYYDKWIRKKGKVF